MSMSDNPRAVAGGNEPESIDYARLEIDRLNQDYGYLGPSVDELLAEAEALPEEIPDDETKGLVASLIKRMRDSAKRIEGIREIEGAPHYRRKQGVDQFFFGLADRLLKRNPRDRAGAGDVLQARLTAYDTKKLREEQERRRVEAERLRREEAERERIAREAQAKAEADRLAAERARNPEKIAEKAAVADQSEVAVAPARAAAEVASAAATEARMDTYAKPADIMRQRGADGTLSTMQTEPYAVVTDAALLDKEKLWPFIKLEAKEQALRAWAKTTGHSQQMAGADIGKRPRSVVR